MFLSLCGGGKVSKNEEAAWLKAAVLGAMGNTMIDVEERVGGGD